MKTSTFLTAAVLLHASLSTSCAPLMGRFGYYKHPQALRAPPEEAESFRFPLALDSGIQLTGPMMNALKVAMDEYRPPSIQLLSLDTTEDRCLARWENIHATIQQTNDNLFFVRFTPFIRECAPEVIVFDAGVVYAIDRQGHILAAD